MPAGFAQPIIHLASPRYRVQIEPVLAGAGFTVVPFRGRIGPADIVELAAYSVTIVDLRGAVEEGLDWIGGLGPAVDASGGALLALLRHQDANILPQALAAGATQFLVSPIEQGLLLNAVQFAQRQADQNRRMGAPPALSPMLQPKRTGKGRRASDLNPGGDAITGLPSEQQLIAWIDEALAEPDRMDPGVAVLHLGLGRFEQINSVYGRTAGDSILRAVGSRLGRALELMGYTADGSGSRKARLARLAGAEFLVCLPAPVQLGEAVVAAQALAETFDRPFIGDGRLIYLNCRIGIAAADAEVSGAPDLLRRSGAALLRAREQPPNSFFVWSPDALDDTQARLEMASHLQHAVASNRLEVAFQPQVEIATERVIGAEALVRWPHPTMGLIEPPVFIEVAEDSELIMALGEQVARKAMALAAHWPTGQAGPLRLSVNVSSHQLRDPDFASRMLQLVEETGFDPAYLTLEMTESAVMENLSRSIGQLEQLRSNGVRLALDDFGTGHSTLGYLKSLPFDYLKIDRSFIQELGSGARENAMLHAIVGMALTLGMGVVAEGVETQEQLDLLRREGCTSYQGYLRAPPLNDADMRDLLQTELRHASAA
jgi:diguanylate cyclase (GGDEF)-like protein